MSRRDFSEAESGVDFSQALSVMKPAAIQAYAVPTVDWERLKKMARNIGPAERVFHTIGTALLGAGTGGLLGGLALTQGSSQEGNVLRAAYWVASLATFVIGAVCLVCHFRVARTQAASAGLVVDEMDHVERKCRPEAGSPTASEASQRRILAMYYAEEGDWPSCERELTEVVSSHPLDTEARCDLAVVFGKLGRWEDSERESREVVRLAPEFARGHATLGAALGARNKLTEAVGEARKALEIDPTSTMAKLVLKKAEYELRQQQEACSEQI